MLGLPATQLERTVFDLVLADASWKYLDFDYGKLRRLLGGRYGEKHGWAIYQGLVGDSGILGD